MPYIDALHVRTRTRIARPLGRPAAAPAGLVERGSGGRRVHDRQRHLPHPGLDRPARGRRAAVPAQLGAGRSGDAVRGAHLCRARGDVPALRGDLRLHPRGVRAPAGVPVRLGGIADHPPRRLRRDLDHLVGVHAAGARRRSGGDGRDARGPDGACRAGAGRGVRRRRRGGELRRHPPRGHSPEREHRLEGRRPHRAGAAGLRAERCAWARSPGDAGPAGAGGTVALPARDGGNPMGIRRLGRSGVRGRGSARPGAQPAPGDVHRDGQCRGVVSGG